MEDTIHKNFTNEHHLAGYGETTKINANIFIGHDFILSYRGIGNVWTNNY